MRSGRSGEYGTWRVIEGFWLFILSKKEISCKVLKKLYPYPVCFKVPSIWLHHCNLAGVREFF